ncbi:protein of unknown function DUF159 [Asticcacaulis excentricus CB 48]|uniref:Abasic site processing protein n=2 Tax=Asticcacaulis excentricus TaxID=78587 RepID=E8RUD1_ASTEC|nr:protein of unknown function DUF159 [Asticcacaulis excentricus CB 48]
MCGQFLALKAWRDFLSSLGMTDEGVAEVLNDEVKPTDAYPIVTAGPQLMNARWGLIPRWAKETPKASTFSARIETAAEKPTFRGTFARRHALVPVAGVYEWHQGRRHRTARRDGEPLVMVGRRQWQGWFDNSVFDPALPPDDLLDIADDDAAPVKDTLF